VIAASDDRGRVHPDAIRVLLVDDSDRGGLAHFTACLRVALEAEGASVALAAPRPLGDAGLELRSRKWGSDMATRSRAAVYAQRLGEVGPSAVALARAVARARPDVVHFQTEVVPGIDHVALRLISRRAPVVLTIHDPIPMEGGAGFAADQARRWKAADALVLHGEQPSYFVGASAPGVPVHVVPVDLPLGGPPVPRDEARRRLGLDDAPTAVLLGQLREYKGLRLLADSWSRVVDAVPGARLLVVGEVYRSDQFDRLAATPGVEIRAGFIPDDDLDAWAAAADVLVLPYHAGAHSGILHRGLAAGTPVLASPALAEEVYRTGAGAVAPLEVTAWGDALADALAHPLLAPTAPTGNETATRTLAIYRDLMEARRRPGHGGP